MPFEYDETGLRVPVMQRQLLSNWCWAASAIFVCNWYNTHPDLSQKSLVADVLNIPPCAVRPLPPCNRTCDLAVVFGHVGHLSGQPLERPLSQEEVIHHFQHNQRPIGCQMNLPQIGGHAVVLIHAYVNPSGTLRVQVGDPADGSIGTMDYDKFLDDYRGHDGYWVRSYFTA